jgi:hypothetical protein
MSTISRLKNINGTVHWAVEGKVACGYIATHASWLAPTVERVTCKRCAAQFGSDEANTAADQPYVNEHRARRDAERAARQAARQAS